MKELVERAVKSSEVMLQSKVNMIEGKLDVTEGKSLAEIKIVQERRPWW